MYLLKKSVLSLSPLDILYTRRFLLTMRVLWDSITTRSTRCDLLQQPELCSWLQEWYLLFSVTVRLEIEIMDHVWNMKWLAGVTNSINIGENWWSQLQKLSYSSRENRLRENEHPWKNLFSRENRMSQECFERSLRVSSGNSNGERHMSWSWRGLGFVH